MWLSYNPTDINEIRTDYLAAAKRAVESIENGELDHKQENLNERIETVGMKGLGRYVLYIGDRNSSGGKKYHGRGDIRKAETACYFKGHSERIVI